MFNHVLFCFADGLQSDVGWQWVLDGERVLVTVDFKQGLLVVDKVLDNVRLSVDE